MERGRTQLTVDIGRHLELAAMGLYSYSSQGFSHTCQGNEYVRSQSDYMGSPQAYTARALESSGARARLMAHRGPLTSALGRPNHLFAYLLVPIRLTYSAKSV